MKNWKLYYLCLFSVAAISIVGCKDDDENPEPQGNQITITIEKPVDDEGIAISECAEVHVHVEVMATEENHEIEVILHPEDDVNNRIINYTLHDHDVLIVLDQDANLCDFPSGTCFHLEVEACVSHDCEVKERADAEFCLQ